MLLEQRWVDTQNLIAPTITHMFTNIYIYIYIYIYNMTSRYTQHPILQQPHIEHHQTLLLKNMQQHYL